MLVRSIFLPVQEHVLCSLVELIWFSQINLASFVVSFYVKDIPRAKRGREKVKAESLKQRPTYLAISRPGQRSTLGWLCLAAGTDNFLLQFIYSDLAFQVPDLEAGARGSTEPVSVRALMMTPPSSIRRCLPLLRSTAWPGHRPLRKHRGIHLERQSPCSGSPCGLVFSL